MHANSSQRTKQTRRSFLKSSGASLAVLTLGCRAANSTKGTIPVIVDTDIGDDIDDTWALLMLLRMQQFDLRLAVGDYGNAVYRARLLAKLLDLTGRSDVPIGVGIRRADNRGNQSDWLGDYRLADYPGIVHEDGVQALIDAIHSSPEPVTLLCLGPVPNIAEALRRDPTIAEHARIVGMYGSINTGYSGEANPAAEWNVRLDPKSLQALFAAPWDITITPLDTCGLVHLKGDNYRQIYESNDPWLKALVENYKVWLPNAPHMNPNTDPSRVSSTLFDTVAVYLAAEQDLVEMMDLPLRVTDEGYTIIDEAQGRVVHCATAWRNLASFEKKLTDILIDSVGRRG
jgi:inosine-uridine nucleoside N-ribohydrolase